MAGAAGGSRTGGMCHPTLCIAPRYRITSLIRTPPLLGPYSTTLPWVLLWNGLVVLHCVDAQGPWATQLAAWCRCSPLPATSFCASQPCPRNCRIVNAERPIGLCHILQRTVSVGVDLSKKTGWQCSRGGSLRVARGLVMLRWVDAQETSATQPPRRSDVSILPHLHSGPTTHENRSNSSRFFAILGVGFV